MASNIKTLKEDNGDIVYPQTLTGAVYTSNNTALDTELAKYVTAEDIATTVADFGTVTTGMIADSAITTAKISNDAVTSSKIDWSTVSYYNYSTSEQIIGTWIDGKPLYRRVYDATSPSSIDTTTTVLTLDNSVGTMIKLYGMLYNTSVPLSVPLPSVLSNDNYFRLTFNPTTKEVQMGLHNSSYTSCNCKIIAEYTKNTD